MYEKYSSVPYTFIQFAIYSKVQNIINPDNVYNPTTNCAAGAVAGGMAAFLTTPLDVVKTTLNTQENFLTRSSQGEKKYLFYFNTILDGATSVQRIGSVRQAILTILASNQSSNPISPFFRGFLPRTLYYAPGTGLSWFAYEAMKSMLHSSSSQKG